MAHGCSFAERVESLPSLFRAASGRLSVAASSVEPMSSAVQGAPSRWESQRSFDELGRPLRDLTFCVVDLETTGGSAAGGSMITEIGAVKVRGGEVLGRVPDAGQPAHRDPRVHRGPHRDQQPHGLPTRPRSSPRCRPSSSSRPAACWWRTTRRSTSGSSSTSRAQQGRPWPRFEVLDTAKLARRVITRDDAPNCKLSSLARVFNSATTPNHRALSDARATVDVLHGLMERLGGLGVHTLEELQTFSVAGQHRPAPKRHLAEGLPHSPGVYLFRDDRARVLYVGTSRDLRTRVRSYFTASETRTRMGEMVGLASSVTGIECATTLEAEVRELRLIAEHKPRYNRRSRFPEKVHFVKLTREPWPRLSLVRRVLDDEADYLGPFSSRKTAEKCLAALHDTFPVRQCSDRLGPRAVPGRLRARRDGPLPGAVRRQRRRHDVRRGRPAAARHAAAPSRRGGRRDQRADGGAGGRRALRGGRGPPRPALRVRPGGRPHPAPQRADPVRRGGGGAPRGRRPLGGARGAVRAAGRRRGHPARGRRPPVRRSSCGRRPRPSRPRRGRSRPRPPRRPRRSCAGWSPRASAWSRSTASGPARWPARPGTSRCTTRSTSPGSRWCPSRSAVTSRRSTSRPASVCP